MVAGLVGGTSLLVGAWVVVASLRAATEGRLRRNGIAGVRTSATLSSDEAWLAGHRAALPRSTVGGAASAVIGVVAVVVTLAGASEAVQAAVVLAGAACLVTGTLAGCVAGNRAAVRVLRDGAGQPDG